MNKYLDNFQIIGFAISTGITIALIFIGHNTINSVVLGLMLSALVQLFDLQKRNNQATSRLQETMGVHTSMYQDPELTLLMREIIDNYSVSKGHWFELFNSLALNSLKDCNKFLHALAEGNYKYEMEAPHTFGTSGIAFAQSHLNAVTRAEPKFWSSIKSKKYLKSQEKLISKGIKITRIFIINDQERDAVSEIIQMQESIGIHCLVVSEDDIPRELHESFIVMDDKLINRGIFNNKGQMANWEMSINSVKVAEMVGKFEVIKRRARPLKKT